MPNVVRSTRYQHRTFCAAMISLSVALLPLSCRTQTQFNRSQTSHAATNTPPTGSEGSGLGSQVDNGVEYHGQTITHYDDDKSRIAQAFLPAGALAVGQTITMASSYHTDPSDLIDEFGIKKGGTIKETQVATVVSSNIHENLKQPMTVALDLPPAPGLMGLIWHSRYFFVVYTVHDSSRNQWRRGIMPDEAMEIRNDRVMFQSNMLGRYEIFESVDPIAYDIKEKPAAKPDFQNPPISLNKISPLVARPTVEVIIDGKYFTKNTTVTIGGKSVPSTLVSPQQVRAYMPSGTSFGKVLVELTDGSTKASSEIIAHTKSDAATVPYADVSEAQVCDRVTFYNMAGEKKTGTKPCNLASCTSEGQQTCAATSNFPAQNPAEIQGSKIFTSHRSILGMPSTMAIPSVVTLCTSNGQKDCRVSGSYIALKKGTLSAALLKKGITIPAGGEISAAITGSFPSLASPLPDYDSALHLLTESGFNSALSNATAYQFWDRFGNRQLLKGTTTFASDAVKQGVNIYGVVGDIPGNKTACDKSGQDNCQVTDSYVIENKPTFIEANFKKGYVLGTITGTYPSATAPLGTVPPGETEITTAAGFSAAIKSAANFTYFNSLGEKVVAQGSSAIKGENLLRGKSAFGIVGTVDSVATNTLTPMDIRAGVTIAGVAGDLRTNCRNLAEPSVYNNEGDHAQAGLDSLDNVIDVISPRKNPWTKPEYVCQKDQWQMVSTPAECATNSPALCAFKDKTTGYVWGGFMTTSKKTWSGAKDYCATLNATKFQGFSSGWQLPTIYDLYEASAHGLLFNREHNQKFLDLNIADLMLWSDTASGNTSKKYTLHGHIGYATSVASHNDVNSRNHVICVHKN